MTGQVLVLGGTGEARRLASALLAAGVEVLSNLAGRVAEPVLPEGDVRIGGFGGAEGLDTAVLARADHVLSLGPMTWPHMLVRVMLAEQLFRAQSILSGHPYHRTSRP